VLEYPHTKLRLASSGLPSLLRVSFIFYFFLFFSLSKEVMVMWVERRWATMNTKEKKIGNEMRITLATY